LKHNSLAMLVIAIAASATGLGTARARDVVADATKEAEKTVTVLRDEDCGSSAIARIKEIASQLGLKIHVVEVIITTHEQAEEHRYFGSPTVRIKGLDIDPKARARTSYALG
jgi:hypothetical protein